jgi:hypothetical protein
MHLIDSELNLFFKIWFDLLWIINTKHNIIDLHEKPVYGTNFIIPFEGFFKISSALWDNIHWFDEVLSDNNNGMTNEELEILTAWRFNYIKNDFVVLKHLPKYSIFVLAENPEKIYGVYGLSDPIKFMLPCKPPIMVHAVLLPFKNKIIFDGCLKIFTTTLSPDYKSSLNMVYEKIKAKNSIIIQLTDVNQSSDHT